MAVTNSRHFETTAAREVQIQAAHRRPSGARRPTPLHSLLFERSRMVWQSPRPSQPQLDPIDRVSNYPKLDFAAQPTYENYKIKEMAIVS